MSSNILNFHIQEVKNASELIVKSQMFSISNDFNHYNRQRTGEIEKKEELIKIINVDLMKRINVMHYLWDKL